MISLLSLYTNLYNSNIKIKNILFYVILMSKIKNIIIIKQTKTMILAIYVIKIVCYL